MPDLQWKDAPTVNKVLAVLAVAVPLFFVWRCAGAVFDDDTPGRRSTAAVQSATTVRRATTTTARADRCVDDIADVQNSTQLASLELGWFAQAAASGDVDAAQIAYDNAMLLGEVAIDRVDAFLAECGSYARAAGTYSDMRQGSATAESALAEMRRTCRADLAQFGFDC